MSGRPLDAAVAAFKNAYDASRAVRGSAAVIEAPSDGRAPVTGRKSLARRAPPRAHSPRQPRDTRRTAQAPRARSPVSRNASFRVPSGSRRRSPRSRRPTPRQDDVLKLNGGLGTSMGLDSAKSLLKVKGADTFLDLTAKQICRARHLQTNVKFVMNRARPPTRPSSRKVPRAYADPNWNLSRTRCPKFAE